MSTPLCQVCSAQPSKYTCPRCSTRSCSLACSRRHKSTTGCDGQRDKVAYVPLKDYGYGKLMDDYVFLEDGKRKAEQWGKEIVGLKMEHREESSVKPLPAKSLALKKALREREIQVDFLPDGMERRRKNQSHFNQKNQLVQLSMEFKYASPSSPSAYSDPAPAPTQQMQNIPLTSTTTLERIYTVQARKIPPHYPSAPTGDNGTAHDSVQELVFAMPVHHPSGVPLSAPPSTVQGTTPSLPAARFYPPFSATAPLESALRGTSFVEYPTIHVFLRRHWDQLLADGRVVVVPLPDRADTHEASSHPESSRIRPGGPAEPETPSKRPRVEGSTTDVHEPPPVVNTSKATDASFGSAQPNIERDPTQDVKTEQGNATSGLLALDYGTESEEEG